MTAPTVHYFDPLQGNRYTHSARLDWTDADRENPGQYHIPANSTPVALLEFDKDLEHLEFDLPVTNGELGGWRRVLTPVVVEAAAESVAETAEDLAKRLERLVDIWINQSAEKLGYRSFERLMAYASINSSPDYQKAATEFGAWVGRLWPAFYAKLAKWQDGRLEVPATPEELFEQLPQPPSL